MKLILFISILNIFSALNLSLKNTAKSKLSKRLYSTRNRQNYNNDGSSTPSINSISIQKSIISALISFQIVSLSQTNGLQFIERTNAANDNLISINTEILDSKIKEIQNVLTSITPNTEGLSAESKSIIDSLQKSLNDIKTKLPTLTLNTDNFKVKYRNKQFYVDFDLPNLPSSLDTPASSGSDVSPSQIQNEIIKSMNSLIDKKPLLTTTIQSSDSYIAQLPAKTPYYKELIKTINDRIINPEYTRSLQDFVSTTLPQFLTASLTDFKYLIPLSIILVIISDIIQSKDQYKRLNEVNDDEIKSLQSIIQSQSNNIDQLKIQLQSKDNEILSIQESIKIEKENIKKQEILKVEQEKKSLIEKQNFEKMQKIKFDQDAIQLAIKGKDMFMKSITALVQEYDNKNMDLPNFETLMTKPVIATEEQLVLEIKHKKLSESDTKELIEKVAKQLNGLIMNEMQQVEKLINNAKSKRDYEKKRESESNERMNKIKGVGVTTSATASAASNPTSDAVSVVIIPSKAEMDHLITDLIHVAEENIVHDEEAEEIAEIEAKDRVELENEHKVQIIQQKEDAARTEYENKLTIEREKRLKLLKQPPPGTITMTPSSLPVTLPVIPTLTRSEAKQSYHQSAASTATSAVMTEEDAEMVAEAEAIMRLEEEALMKIQSDNKDVAKGIKLNTNNIPSPPPPPPAAATSSLKPKINIKKTSVTKASTPSAHTPPVVTTTAAATAVTSSKKSSAATKSTKKSTPAASKTTATTTAATVAAAVTKSATPVAVMKDTSATSAAMDSNSNNLIKTLKALTPSQLRRRTRSQLESDISVLKSLRPASSSDSNSSSATPIDELNKEALAGIIETYIKN